MRFAFDAIKQGFKRYFSGCQERQMPPREWYRPLTRRILRHLVTVVFYFTKGRGLRVDVDLNVPRPRHEFLPYRSV